MSETASSSLAPENGNGRCWRRWPAYRAYRAMRRGWRSLRRRWSAHGVGFVFHEAYSRRLPGVPHDDQRAERILAFLADEGLVERSDIEVPRAPSMRNLLRVHSDRYLESLQNPDTMLKIFGVALGDEELERTLETQRLMVGGTIFALRLARHGRGIAFNLGGGFHHAHRDEGMAFCVFNDVAIAITRLRARGFKAPILVVDLDLHDGNGTRSIFAHDPTVHTYSIHNQHWGDIEAEASTSIALGDDVTDEMYLGTLLKTLPPVAEEVNPGLVVYVAGTDPAADDRMGNWKITPEGMLSRDRFVIELFRRRRRAVPVAVVLGGGYGDRAWGYTARFVAQFLAGRVIEPPLTEELTLRHFHRLRASLDHAALTAEPGDFSWELTDEDLVGIIPGGALRTRFLNYFSRHGIELVLERFGVLDQLRVRGFQHPSVELDLNSSTGQTLRIFGCPDRQELVMELRVDRSSRVVPGCEVLVIEWLLLQNPRAEFGPFRRPLPGQKHPGLGMLKQLLSCLVMIGEILKLDGVYYSPSHFHVAAQSRQFVRFLKPEHEADFRVLHETLSHLALAAATQAVAEGRVRNVDNGETFRWQGYPMVLPATQRLKEQVFGDEYEARVVAALEGIRYELLPARDAGMGRT